MKQNPLQKSQKDSAVSAARNSSTASLTTPYIQTTILHESLKKMALHLLSQFLYSLSHHSCTQHNHLRKFQKDGAASALAIPLQHLSPLPTFNQQSFTKVSKRWRCICSRNSSTASLTTHARNTIIYESIKKMALHLLSQFLYSLSHHFLYATQSTRKFKKDGAASALAIPLQPLSPLPAPSTIIYESLKKMALYLLSLFLYSLSHYSLHATQSFTKVSKRWRCICSPNSSTASLTILCRKTQ
jgi:hypothetical protein